MASIFVSGIAFAALTAGLAASSLAAPVVAPSQPHLHRVNVEIAGLRSGKGVVRLCMTSRVDAFPACKKGAAMTASVAASKAGVRYTFDNVPAGTYAIAAFHDENGNGKMDKMLAMPKEGFAFSENPPMRPRAPTFAEAHFNVSADAHEVLRMRYIL